MAVTLETARFEHCIRLLMQNANIQVLELKLSCYSRDKTGLPGFDVTMDPDLCEQNVKYLGLAASGLRLPVRTRPVNNVFT